MFERIHDNALEVWKWEMYRLLAEFEKRPTLPPPLSLIEDAVGYCTRTAKTASAKKGWETTDSFVNAHLIIIL